MMIRLIEPGDHNEWRRMRQALWPTCSAAKHETEMARWAVFVAARPDRGLGGFVEVSIREQAEGCDTHPIEYVEFWYVDPDTRRQGIGSQLLAVAGLGEDYIACDSRDRSELVLPLFDDSATCWGVLDVDSHEIGAFDDADVAGLQRVLQAAGLTIANPPAAG